jgi:hypothetical protein
MVFFSLMAKPFYLLAKSLLLSKTFIYFWLNLYPSTKHISFHGKLSIAWKKPYIFLVKPLPFGKTFFLCG